MSHPNRINERQLETNVLADAAAINDGILSEMPDEKGPGAARCECHLVVEILAKNIIEQVARSDPFMFGDDGFVCCSECVQHRLSGLVLSAPAF